MWVRTAVTKRNVLPIVSEITFVLNAELNKKSLWASWAVTVIPANMESHHLDLVVATTILGN